MSKLGAVRGRASGCLGAPLTATATAVAAKYHKHYLHQRQEADSQDLRAALIEPAD